MADGVNDTFGGMPPTERESATHHGRVSVGRDGLARDLDVSGAGLRQTGETFGFKCRLPLV